MGVYDAQSSANEIREAVESTPLREVRRQGKYAQHAMQTLLVNRRPSEEIGAPMSNQALSRRDFQRLTMAAFGGLVAGCQQQEPAAGPPADAAGEPTAVATAGEKNPLLDEPHVCRGLNTCKGFGSDSCAGRTQCATDSIKHECGTRNACRGQGGCGSNPGENACKGQGGCSVPLMDAVWERTRKRFEELMAAQGKEVGPAPPGKS
jgi:hypothetical protein